MSNGTNTWWTSGWDDHHLDILRTVGQVMQQHASEDVCARWDVEGHYPHEAMDALGAAGWAGLAVPVEFGGDGASATDLAVVHMALARSSLAVAQTYYSLWVLGAEAINRLGNDTQKADWLPRIAKGQARVAFALTEPEAGSDAAALRTRATRTPAGWSVSGQKVFITGAANCEVIVTAVRTGTEGGRDGISLLMIDPHGHGVTVRPLRKIGLHALDLNEVFLDQVNVRHGHELGEIDRGWQSLRSGLAQERLYLAAISTGALVDLIERSLDHAKTRQAFGRPIGDQQLIADKIVRARIAAEAASQLVLRAAALLDAGDPDAAAHASVAKIYATEAYVTGARDAVQIFGGSGYVEESPVARHYRDSKYLEIGGGTTQIQTIIVARSMGLRP